MSNPQSTEKPAFVFQPPPGGDLALRSNDGSVFLVHSIILGLVSPVFSDMFSIGKPSGEAIELDDDAESISIILAFIYPSSIWPTVDNVDMLEKCLKIAQKYNVEKIPQALDRDLSLNSSLIRNSYDPLRIFRLAVTYRLRNCQTIAAKAVMPTHIDFREPDEVVKAAQDYPNAAHVIGLISVQTMRIQILTDIMFDLEDEFLPKTYKRPKDKKDDEGSELLMCKRCASRMSDAWAYSDPPFEYIPSWLYGWSREAYRELSVRPLEHCEHLFELNSLIGLDSFIDVCESCVLAAREARLEPYGRPGEAFESWVSRAKALITRRLKELDPLYSL